MSLALIGGSGLANRIPGFARGERERERERETEREREGSLSHLGRIGQELTRIYCSSGHAMSVYDTVSRFEAGLIVQGSSPGPLRENGSLRIHTQKGCYDISS